MAPTTELPPWLGSTWSRNYIRRQLPQDGSTGLGEPDSSVTVRYIQTLAEGHSFDLRIKEDFSMPSTIGRVDDMSLEQLLSFASEGAVEAFAGVTTSERSGDSAFIIRWHAAFTFPPNLADAEEPISVLDRIRSGQHETEDVGRAVPTLPAGRGKPTVHWYEYSVPEGSYEEEWVMFEDFYARGAHFAAVRPARPGVGTCWLGVLGNTFAFVRDVDRAALADAVRGRQVADVLADDAIPLQDKQRALDCEFSFGRFGQNGGVGGVVEFSSLPWRKGVALATLLGDDEEARAAWEPIRAADAQTMRQAIDAVLADHAKACQMLAEAEASGQAGVVEMMKARGAVA
jgi:hypothetical protein